MKKNSNNYTSKMILRPIKLRNKWVILGWIILPLLIGGMGPANSFNSAETHRIIFYNAENLFDTLDSPGVRDEAFTPGGARKWDFWKYREKLIKLSRVIIHTGGWELPSLVCLCEIENRKVLEDLLRLTPLKNSSYRIIHFDSKDKRGIDVAMLYRPEKVHPIMAKPIQIRFPSHPEKTSRDILYCHLELITAGKYHLFVNHWPSKYGGEKATIPFRMDAAKCLQSTMDSIWQKIPDARMIACGDFNDGPHEESLQYLTNNSTKPLTNLMLNHIDAEGTHKHAGHWETLDQFIVSKNVLEEEFSGMAVKAGIFQAPYLMQEELNQTGHRPYRSFAGTFYQGGYSDHLPIYLDLTLSPEIR